MEARGDARMASLPLTPHTFPERALAAPYLRAEGHAFTALPAFSALPAFTALPAFSGLLATWLMLLISNAVHAQTPIPFPTTSPTATGAPPTYPTYPTYPTSPTSPPTYGQPTFPMPTTSLPPSYPTTVTPTYPMSVPTTTAPTTPYTYNPYPSNPYPSNPYAPTFRESTAPTATGFPPGTIPMGAYPPGTFPMTGVPPGTMPMSGVPPGTMPMSAFPTSVYPNQQPPVLYPGMTAPNPFGLPPGTAQPTWWTTTTTTVQAQATETMRLCQGFRFRYTYLPGNSDFGTLTPTELASNDFDFSFVFAIPRFFGCSQPLYLMPSYTQTLWSGPSVPGSDLPGAAFGAFLDSSWETDPAQTWGAELGVRVGVFSDFDAISSESIRYPFKAVGRVRCTPNSTARAGIYYIDRNKVKLLPALGILWVPNPDTRWDIFFPEPKLSHYLTTHGTKDVWWYVTSYYGGGAWTIEHPNGADDRIDINDVRIMAGFECGNSDLLRQGFRNYFVEFGYAFNRQLVYVNNPQKDVDLGDSLVFRAGFGY